MSLPTKVVVVDDTDAGIVYTGAWTADSTGSQDGFGLFGPAYNHTLHEVTVDGASASYTFTGSTIQVYGTIDTDGKDAPQWTCLVDNVPISSFPPGQNPQHENNYLLCQSLNLTSSTHSLVVSPSFPSSNSVFWLDSLSYQPVAGQEPEGSVFKIDDKDTSLTYSGNWVTSSFDSGIQTTTAGSTVTVPFNGTMISLFGTAAAGNANSATFSIDGGAPNTFTINPTTVTGGISQTNQEFFTCPPLPLGSHTLVVTFNGSPDSIPLSVDYFQVLTTPFPNVNGSPFSTSGTTDPSSTSSSTSTSSPASPLGSTQSHSNINIGAIIGGAIGGLILILLIAVLVFILRRQRAAEGSSSRSGTPESKTRAHRSTFGNLRGFELAIPAGIGSPLQVPSTPLSPNGASAAYAGPGTASLQLRYLSNFNDDVYSGGSDPEKGLQIDVQSTSSYPSSPAMTAQRSSLGLMPVAPPRAVTISPVSPIPNPFKSPYEHDHDHEDERESNYNTSSFYSRSSMGDPILSGTPPSASNRLYTPTSGSDSIISPTLALEAQSGAGNSVYRAQKISHPYAQAMAIGSPRESMNIVEEPRDMYGLSIAAPRAM